MNDTAPEVLQAFLATRPRTAVIAELFTFQLLSGPIYRFTDWRRPVTAGGVTWVPGPPRLGRGKLRLERGLAVTSTDVTLQEANGPFIAKLAKGYFNRALFTQQRVFAASREAALAGQWLGPLTKFFGRVNAISAIAGTSATLTAKSMLDDLDNDYPRQVIQPDCDAVLFDAKCGLQESLYLVQGSAQAGSTKNSLLASNLNKADGYFTQGVIYWTSGVLAGLNYLVKSQTGNTLLPSMPFLTAPAPGDTFSVRPGCDKTLATCISKFGYNPAVLAAPFFRGSPFVPDPTVTY